MQATLLLLVLALTTPAWSAYLYTKYYFTIVAGGSPALDILKVSSSNPTTSIVSTPLYRTWGGDDVISIDINDKNIKYTIDYSNHGGPFWSTSTITTGGYMDVEFRFTDYTGRWKKITFTNGTGIPHQYGKKNLGFNTY